MSNDTELKCKVEESVSDDFIFAARQLGFETRSEFLRYLVHRELYGVESLVQVNRSPGAYTGPKAQETGR